MPVFLPIGLDGHPQYGGVRRIVTVRYCKYNSVTHIYVKGAIGCAVDYSLDELVYYRNGVSVYNDVGGLLLGAMALVMFQIDTQCSDDIPLHWGLWGVPG
jgi:hypothetical protein